MNFLLDLSKLTNMFSVWNIRFFLRNVLGTKCSILVSTYYFKKKFLQSAWHQAFAMQVCSCEDRYVVELSLSASKFLFTSYEIDQRDPSSKFFYLFLSSIIGSLYVRYDFYDVISNR